MTPTDGLIRQMVDQNDQKHEAGHKRLRIDLTEGLNDVNRQIERCKEDSGEIKLDIARIKTARETEMRVSAQRFVVLGSLVGALTSFAMGLALLLARKALGF